MYANEIEKIKLKPLKQPTWPILEWIGAGWNWYSRRDTSNPRMNIRRGGLMVGLAGVTTAALLGVACANKSEDQGAVIPPCVNPSGKTQTIMAHDGDTKNELLKEIDGVEEGTCMQTAENMTITVIGDLDAPREGHVFTQPVELIPAAEASAQLMGSSNG